MTKDEELVQLRAQLVACTLEKQMRRMAEDSNDKYYARILELEKECKGLLEVLNEWKVTAHTYHADLAKAVKRNEELEELAKERNMISDLINYDGDSDNGVPIVDIVLDAHDAHSFWSTVRYKHTQLFYEGEDDASSNT